MKISLNLIQYLSIWPKTFLYPPPALVQLPIILCSRYYFLSCLLVITTPPPPTPTTHRTDVLNNGREGGDSRAYNVTVNYGQCGMLLAFHIFSNQHYSAKDFFREKEKGGMEDCVIAGSVVLLGLFHILHCALFQVVVDTQHSQHTVDKVELLGKESLKYFLAALGESC